jgi:hypothetical protein
VVQCIIGAVAGSNPQQHRLQREPSPLLIRVYQLRGCLNRLCSSKWLTTNSWRTTLGWAFFLAHHCDTPISSFPPFHASKRRHQHFISRQLAHEALQNPPHESATQIPLSRVFFGLDRQTSGSENNPSSCLRPYASHVMAPANCLQHALFATHSVTRPSVLSADDPTDP